MKSLMLIKRFFLVIFVIAVLIFNLKTDTFLADAIISAQDRFGSDYSVAHILGNYSYFVGGNMSGNAVAHTSGPIVVGGELDFTSAGFGNLLSAPSYINHIKGLGYINAPFPGTEYLQEKRVVYYGTVDANVASYLFYNENGNNTKDNVLFCNPEYIDVGAAMQALRSEANAMAATGSQNAYVNRNGEIEVDFKKAASVTITEPLNKIQKIILKNVTIEELMQSKYVISFTASGEASVNAQMVWLNGRSLDQQFKEYAITHSSESASTGGQYYLHGMNLIWNFPNASKVTYINLNGHLLAPNAEVKVLGGRHEGGIVAASLYTESEAHFYPYQPKKPNEPTSEEPVEPTSEEPVEPTSEEPVEPTSEEPVEPTSEEPVEPTSEEPVEPTSEEPVEPTSEEPNEPTSEEPNEPTSEEPVEPTSEESNEPTSEESNEPTSEESIASTSEIPYKTEVEGGAKGYNTAVQTSDQAVPVTVGILAGISIFTLGLNVCLKYWKKQ